LNITNDTVNIFIGNEVKTFHRDQIVAIAHGRKKELDVWSAKISLGLTIIDGNTERLDASAIGNAKRRTSTNRIVIDYLGNYSETDSKENNMSSLKKIIVLILIMGLAFSHCILADSNEPLIIATKVTPPFVIKRDDGSLTGISIELWRDMATRLGIEYVYKEMDLEALFNAVSKHEVDAGIAALTVTTDRELNFNFSHPFHTTGLGIAVPHQQEGTLFGTLKNVSFAGFVKAIFYLFLIVLVISILMWFVEKRKNSAQFGGSFKQGIGSASWWALVTVTTTGYGDKAPITLNGKLIAVVWMFIGIFIMSAFSGSISSSMTLAKLSSNITGPNDLAYVNVGTIGESISSDYLDGQHIVYTSYNNLEQGLVALNQGDLDAFVYDAPLLQYQIKKAYSAQLKVLPNTFQRQDYAIALPNDSPYREAFNRLLIEIIHTDEWNGTLAIYLGQP